jgi:hypothetical protein
VKWLEQTHGTTFELVRHFLARMLDGEWSSTRGQWQNVAVGAFALLLPGSMVLLRSGSRLQGKFRLLAMLDNPEPLRAARMADELGLLTLLFAVTGLIGLIQWQNFFPGRRDYLSLAGLPIRSRQIFLARFAAVLLFSTALVAAMNLLPSLTSANIGAQAVASGLGCFFVLFAMVALQGVLLNTLPARLFARVSAYVQGVLIGALILAGLYSWSVREWPRAVIARLPEFGAWVPPVWFAGLHERILGDQDPFLHRMATRALVAVLVAAGLTVLSYLMSFRRYRRLLVESPTYVGVPRKSSWSLLRLAAGGPQQEAILQFMAKTLVRSRAHRMIWLAYAGAAVGVVVNSSLIDGVFLSKSTEIAKALKFAVLFWPLGTSAILLNGLRHVLSIPAELPANWIFRITESQGRKQWMAAVERFVMLYAVAPIYLAIFPVAVSTLGWPIALRLTTLQVLVSLTMFELLFDSWQQLPFTCSYTPGKRSLVAVVAGYFAVLGMVVPVLALVVRAGAEFNFLFAIYGPLFAGVWIWARRRRRQGWGESVILYEDLPGGMPKLGIDELTWGPVHPPTRQIKEIH